MRLRKSQRVAEGSNGEAVPAKPRRREGRGLGPFSGGQLTIVIVAICAVFALPAAVGAAAGSFTSSNSRIPALKATNTNRSGTGVQGTGKTYGVYSNGPLGVAAGKSLSCKGCVAPAALSSAAKEIQPLAHGQSESGVFGVAGPNDESGTEVIVINYAQRLASPLPNNGTGHIIYLTVNSATHCPGQGHADPGYLCVYSTETSNLTNYANFTFDASRGAELYFSADGSGQTSDDGVYTVTAP
jgi:hypothetical protein